MNSQFHSNEPDPDAIKMFAGQIPRYWDENDLQKLFEEFGPVYQINVLRDKLTNQSKGCCFVTFYTRRAAMEAQSSLHNIKTLPGMQHPIQMKPADSEKRVEERKLFVGMLSKKCSETDVRMMFAPYGTIEECTILREQNGQSRGCAFVTLSSRQCAQNAIRGLHHSRTLEGCRSPLVVKLADSQKDKEMKRLQQMQAQLLNGAGAVGLGALGQALLQQSSSGQNTGLLGNLSNLGLGLNALQMQQILSAAASSLPSSLQNSFGDSSAVGTLQNLQNLQNLAALAALAANSTGMNSSNSSSNPAAFTHMSNNVSGGAAIGANNSTGLHSVSSASSGVGSGLSVGGALGGGPGVLNNHGTGTVGGTNGGLSGGAVGGTDQGYSGMQQYGAAAAGGLSGLLNPALFSNSLSAQTAMSQLKSSANNSLQGSMAGHLTPAGAASMPGFMPNFSTSKQVEGPEGANLFIYHLPQEFNDYDLTQLFSPFGNVLSSKVYIDKQTNLSKCFGFVSYDNPASAQSAIHAMNGYQIGAKRLKVHLKRPKNDPAKLY